MNWKEHPDFDIRYDIRLKRNYWLLGYFGGGSINILDAYNLAIEYVKDYSVPLDSVRIDEVLHSRRYKSYKVIYSTADMGADKNATVSNNVWNDLTQ